MPSDSPCSADETARRTIRSARQQRIGINREVPQRHRQKASTSRRRTTVGVNSWQQVDVAGHGAWRLPRPAHPVRRHRKPPWPARHRTSMSRQAKGAVQLAAAPAPARERARLRQARGRARGSAQIDKARTKRRRSPARRRQFRLPSQLPCGCPACQQKANHCSLSPVNVVATIAGEIGAMPAVRASPQRDVRIGEQFARASRGQADEWIVVARAE